MDKFVNRYTLVYTALCLLIVPLVLIPLVRRPAKTMTTTVPAPNPLAEPPTEPQARPAPGKYPWTLNEAADALARQPDNAYLQYVVVMLARQEKKNPEERLPRTRRERRQGVDLFGVFSGRLAVQESLQLDYLLSDGDPLAAGEREWGEVEVKVVRTSSEEATAAGPFFRGGPWRCRWPDRCRRRRWRSCRGRR